MSLEKLIKLRFLTKSGCLLCDRGIFLLRRVKNRYPMVKIELVDIGSKPEYQKYRQSIPVVLIDETPVSMLKLEERKIRERIEEIMNSKSTTH